MNLAHIKNEKLILKNFTLFPCKILIFTTNCLWVVHNCFLPNTNSEKLIFLSSVECSARNWNILWILKFWSHINGFIHAEWAFHFVYTASEFEMESGRRKRGRSKSGIFDKWVSLIESSLYSKICAIFFPTAPRQSKEWVGAIERKSPWMSRTTTKMNTKITKRNWMQKIVIMRGF